MNILLITNLYPAYNGQLRGETTYALHYFTKEWVRYGFNVRVIRIWPVFPKIFSISKKGRKIAKYRKECIFFIDNVTVRRTTITIYPKIKNFLISEIYKTYKKISKELKKSFIPDVILCHMINPSIFIGYFLKKEFNIPLILIIHKSDILMIKRNDKNLSRYKYIESFIDRIGFRSFRMQIEYNKLMSTDDIKSKDQFIIPSGINQHDIITKKHLKNKLLGIPRKIFIASRMNPQKNIDTVIKAFAQVYSNKNLTLEIAGDGPQRQELLKLANSTSAAKNISFLGYITREKVMEKMQESDIFVMVSSPETLGLVYFEAMAKGCIVIGAKGEGIDGFIKDGENGFLCEPGNVESLKKIFIKITDLPYRERENILIKSVNTVKKMTQEKLSKLYLNIIGKTVDGYFGRTGPPLRVTGRLPEILNDIRLSLKRKFLS